MTVGRKVAVELIGRRAKELCRCPLRSERQGPEIVSGFGCGGREHDASAVGRPIGRNQVLRRQLSRLIGVAREQAPIASAASGASLVELDDAVVIAAVNDPRAIWGPERRRCDEPAYRRASNTR